KRVLDDCDGIRFTIRLTRSWKLFLKHEIDGQNQKYKRIHVVQTECFGFEHYQRKYRKHHQGDDFLDHFQLDQGKRSSIVLESNSVRRNLEHILKQSDSPTDQYDRDQTQLLGPVPF